MSRTLQVSESTPTIPRIYFWASLLLLALLLRTIGECSDPEQPPVPVESVPVAPGPLPPPQEQLLTPIPRQFDWMRRTVRSNPLLESLLRLREVTPRLLMSVSLTEEYSDNFFLSDSDPQDVFRTSLNLGTVYRVRKRTRLRFAGQLHAWLLRHWCRAGYLRFCESIIQRRV